MVNDMEGVHGVRGLCIGLRDTPQYESIDFDSSNFPTYLSESETL